MVKLFTLESSWITSRTRVFARYPDASHVTDYSLQILNAELMPAGEIELDCESDLQAIRIAFSVDSPHGHVLLSQSRLLGRFAPGPLFVSEYKLELTEGQRD